MGRNTKRIWLWGRGVRLENRPTAPAEQVEDLPVPQKLIVPLALYDGIPAGEPALQAGPVKRYQALTKGAEAVRAPLGGMVEKIEKCRLPVWGETPCALLTPTPEEPEDEPVPEGAEEPGAYAILEAARLAGIIDEYDGVPLFRKLRECARGKGGIFALNAADDDPYCTSGAACLLTMTAEALDGLALAARAVGAQGMCVVAMHASFSRGQRREIEKKLGETPLYWVKGYYPVWPFLEHARPLRGRLIGRAGVQALAALSGAVRLGAPQDACVVTVAGDALARRQNVRAPIGTPVGRLLEFCGLEAEPSVVAMGSAMRGVAVQEFETPLRAGDRCVLAFAGRVAPRLAPCVGCGRCDQACPEGLFPSQALRRMERGEHRRARQYAGARCTGCNACSAVCPSGLNVAHLIRGGQAPRTGVTQEEAEEA